MHDLRTVLRLEFLLLLRGRGLPIAAALVALAGVWEASGIREQPWAVWSTLTLGGALVALILTLSTGDQVSRDRTQRLDGVLLSTPVSTAAYVWGKYLAALVALVGLAAVNLAGALLMDRFDPWRDPPPLLQLGHAHFPPLGFRTYAGIWVLLTVTPVVFGVAWMLAGTTLRRGGRIAASTGALVIWLLPTFGNAWPQVLDVSGGRFYSLFDGGSLAQRAMATTTTTFPQAWSPRAAARIIAAVQASLPPALPPVFVWNRALFLCAAVLLVVLTIWSVERRRRGQA